MTVFTPKSCQKGEDTEHLNPAEVVVTDPVPPVKDEADKASIAVVALTSSRRRSSLASVCVLLTALVVFAVGILGGIYLYNKLAHRKYQGWCGVSYFESQTEGYIAGERTRYQGGYQSNGFHGQFEEHVELDRDEGRYEKIDVPEFADCKQATILHDFDKNFTAVVDKDNARCFIIALNYSMVKPPKDFWDLLSKLRTGYYLPDTEIVRENYRVVTPQVENVGMFGYYIWRECQWFDTYRMVREGEPFALPQTMQTRTKRSAVDCSKLKNSYSLGATGMPFVVTFKITSCI